MKTTARWLTGLFVCFVASSSIAADGQPIPEKVLKELSFMVGRWQTEMSENGVQVGTATHERKWAPGNHCIVTDWKAEREGIKSTAVGVGGWNAKAKAVIEHWYSSDGSYFSVRYPIGKMKADAWDGTHRWIDAEGKEFKGNCRLEKKEDQWIFTADWMDGDEKVTMRNVTRKVKE